MFLLKPHYKTLQHWESYMNHCKNGVLLLSFPFIAMFIFEEHYLNLKSKDQMLWRMISDQYTLFCIYFYLALYLK